MVLLKIVIGNKNFSSWSLRPWLVLKHFGIPFEEILIPLDQPNTRLQIEKFSPAGKVPILLDGSLRIWESLAIIEYLAEQNPSLKIWPVNSRARAIARSVANEMHGGFAALRETCPMKVKEIFQKFDFSPAAKDIARVQKIWNECRRDFGADGPFLFGHFSAVDAMFAPVVFRFNSYGIPTTGESQKYIDTMLAQPCMMEWANSAKLEKLTMSRYDKPGLKSATKTKSP
jgi:glutathione S-transferase